MNEEKRPTQTEQELVPLANKALNADTIAFARDAAVAVVGGVVTASILSHIPQRTPPKETITHQEIEVHTAEGSIRTSKTTIKKG